LEKIRKNLTTSREDVIIGGQRVCLIKSDILSMPLYYLSVFKAPKHIYKENVKLQRNFLWEKGTKESKIA